VNLGSSFMGLRSQSMQHLLNRVLKSDIAKGLTQTELEELIIPLDDNNLYDELIGGRKSRAFYGKGPPKTKAATKQDPIPATDIKQDDGSTKILEFWLMKYDVNISDKEDLSS